jgi:cell shape-determining protein MreC
MDFETIFKVIVIAVAAVGIPVGAYAAFVASRAIWVKPGPEGAGELRQVAEELESLKARLGDVEAQQHRLAELEERVDFAERLLAQAREPDRLPRG